MKNMKARPGQIVKLGVDGVNRIWRDAKLRGVGLKRAGTLVTAAEHSIGSREAQEAAVSVVSHSPEFRSIHQYYTTRNLAPRDGLAVWMHFCYPYNICGVRFFQYRDLLYCHIPMWAGPIPAKVYPSEMEGS